ncbi:hypothetical protein BG58_14110 [Caballeronia jiangsuensis]|nr:hypothetical protein BG58_14110 [Caballeronia jiangsuensis]
MRTCSAVASRRKQRLSVSSVSALHGTASSLSPIPRKPPLDSTAYATRPLVTSSMISFSEPTSWPSLLITELPSSVLAAMTSGPGPAAVAAPLPTIFAPAEDGSVDSIMIRSLTGCGDAFQSATVVP